MRPSLRYDSESEISMPARLGLDLIAEHLGATAGQVTCRLAGDPVLVANLHRYAKFTIGGTTGVLLGEDCEDQQIAEVLGSSTELILLVPGLTFRPRRTAERIDQAAPMSSSSGPVNRPMFRLQKTQGVQGPISVAFALLQRLFERVDRPDLADRCKIGMLRTMTPVWFPRIARYQILYFGSSES